MCVTKCKKQPNCGWFNVLVLVQLLHNLFNLVKMSLQRERSGLKLTNPTEYVTGRSPYQLPVISSGVVPVPPPLLQKGDRSLNMVRNGMLQGRRFRPTTAPNDAEQLLTKVCYLCLLLHSLEQHSLLTALCAWCRGCMYLVGRKTHRSFERKTIGNN